MGMTRKRGFQNKKNQEANGFELKTHYLFCVQGVGCLGVARPLKCTSILTHSGRADLCPKTYRWPFVVQFLAL